MNAEISRIRKNRGDSEIIDHKPERLEERHMLEMVYQINSNFSDLYNLQYNNDDIDIDVFVDKITQNTYIVLNMFEEMGIYPDYFYDEIVKMNIDYKKVLDRNGDNSNTLRVNNRLYKESSLSAKVAKTVRSGLEKGYYRIQAYPKKDINDAFLEMITFFEVFKIPYNINTKEQCKKIFNEIKYNQIKIIDEFINSDYIFEDVEYLARLLFEYLSFFVAMGIHPKEYLDKYIDSSNVKKK